MHYISMLAQADASTAIDATTRFVEANGLLAFVEIAIVVVFGAWVVVTARNQKPLIDNLAAMARTNNEALRAGNEVNERLIEVVSANTEEKRKVTGAIDGVISELRLVRTDVGTLSTAQTAAQDEIMPLVNDMRSDVKALRAFADGIEHKWEERLRAIVSEAVAKKRDTQPLPTLTEPTESKGEEAA